MLVRFEFIIVNSFERDSWVWSSVPPPATAVFANMRLAPDESGHKVDIIMRTNIFRFLLMVKNILFDLFTHTKYSFLEYQNTSILGLLSPVCRYRYNVGAEIFMT